MDLCDKVLEYATESLANLIKDIHMHSSMNQMWTRIGWSINWFENYCWEWFPKQDRMRGIKLLNEFVCVAFSGHYARDIFDIYIAESFAIRKVNDSFQSEPMVKICIFTSMQS